jgi:hypothetical protein
VITKHKLAIRIIRALQGGSISDWRKIDPREVYEAIETARNAVMEAFIKKNGILDGEFVTQYINVPVLCDTNTDQKYSVLPARLISFSSYDGIRLVSPMLNQRAAFVKINNGALGIFSKLEAGHIGGNVGYYIERVKDGNALSARIYYVNMPMDYDKVLIKMIASTYDFNDDEQLPIPAEFEDTVYRTAFDLMAIQYGSPSDKTIDTEPIS